MTTQTLVLLVAVLLLWVLASFLTTLKLRQLILLGASYIFYAGWGGLGFLAVLIASSVMNYVFGAWLRRQIEVERLWIGVGFNVLLLGFFKYAAAIVEQVTGLWNADFFQDIALPLGISFWTFQALSYLFDTYRQEEADPTLLEFCLYMAFWPTVLSGPVCRMPAMLPQFRQVHAFNWDDLSIGSRRLCQGIILKFVFAELLRSGLYPGEGVSAGFNYPAASLSGLDVWLLAVGFGFQLYFDFAGYSHIVIGIARIFGFRLTENFDRPYLSTTPSIFWNRWHASLSSWIRDYLFIPMATMRRDRWWPYMSLIITMTLFGLWHGAQSTLILWGTYHGLLLVAHRYGQQTKRRLAIAGPARVGPLFAWLMTFLSVTLGWIFFRAHDLRQALTMLDSVLTYDGYFELNLPAAFYPVTLCLILSYFVLHVGLLQFAAWKERHVRGDLEGCRAFAVHLLELLNARVQCWLTPVMMAIILVITILVTDRTPTPVPFVYTTF